MKTHSQKKAEASNKILVSQRHSCPYEQSDQDLTVIVQGEEDKQLGLDCMQVWQAAYEEHTKNFGSAAANRTKMWEKVNYQWTAIQLYRQSRGYELLERQLLYDEEQTRKPGGRNL